MKPAVEDLNSFLLENGMKTIQFHGTDYAWGFREDEPVIALIAKSDGSEAFQVAMSVYWASAEYIAKPWCLFIITEFEPHQRQMLENLAKQYNIETTSPDNLLSKTEEQLRRLTEILKVYIPEESENQLISLGESMKRWREEKPVKEHSFKVQVETGNLNIYKENGELVPSRKTAPLTAISGDSSIEGILLRLISIDYGLYFDTEHRNLPMVFKLSVSEASSLVLRFEADKSNLIEAASFWSLLKDFSSTNRLAFIEPNTGDILFSCERELDDRGNQKHS